MKNQKGISLIKLIIIIAVIIVGIILIFQMFKPRDGILSVDDAEKQYQNKSRHAPGKAGNACLLCYALTAALLR